MKYLFFLVIIPFLLVPNAVYAISETTPLTSAEYTVDNDNDDVCEDTGGSNYGSVAGSFLRSRTLDIPAGGHDCYRAWLNFDGSNIGISSGNIITTFTLQINVTETDTPFIHRLYLIDSIDIEGQTDAIAFNNIDNGLLLGTFTASSLGVKTLTLNETNWTAILAEASTNGTIQFGIRMDDEILTGNLRGIEFDGFKRWLCTNTYINS